MILKMYCERNCGVTYRALYLMNRHWRHDWGQGKKHLGAIPFN